MDMERQVYELYCEIVGCLQAFTGARALSRSPESLEVEFDQVALVKTFK